MSSNTFSIIILISGSGSNLQAILEHITANQLPCHISAVISNNPEAYGLKRAEKAGIPSYALDHKSYSDREAFDQALLDIINENNPDLVVLAGYMRILSPSFVQALQGKMINIHPSLLPKFRGLHTYERALEANEKHHGSTIHFVSEELDGGPAIARVAAPIDDNETVNSLQSKVVALEHKLYPKVIQWFVEGRIEFNDNRVILDGSPLNKEGVCFVAEDL